MNDPVFWYIFFIVYLAVGAVLNLMCELTDNDESESSILTRVLIFTYWPFLLAQMIIRKKGE
jgi:hypothetical protein